MLTFQITNTSHLTSLPETEDNLFLARNAKSSLPETEDNQLLARNAKSSLPETEDNLLLARNANLPCLKQRITNY